jgi:ABC-type branched-subunit amino acid transport system substrate-binding protein
MLSLSRAQGTAETGDYVFRGQLSDASQVRSLVQHAVTDRGLQRLALVHPANPYGDEMRALFMAAVEAEGGELVQIVSYDPTANDFRTVAQELGQKDYTVRALEFKEMKKEAERRGLKSDKLVLPPIIEFDGIFIADNWKRSAAIASGLAYEEFPVGDFLPNKYTPIIPLMGLNSWHDARITELGGSFIQHAVFVDAFSSVHSGDAAHEWVAYYQESFNGQKPKVLHAVTWDTTRLLASAVLAGGPDRQDIRDSLGQVELLDSVAAGGRFGDNREIARELLFLTIEGEDIVPWTSPEDEEPSGEAIAP